MKKIVLLSISVSIFGISLITSSCEGDKRNDDKSEGAKTETHEANKKAETNENPNYDPNRGQGKFKDITVEKKLNSKMAESGLKIFEVKCSSCHKTTDEKLVGPGWAGVTKRRQPSWIMNFITNPDPMLEKDPAALAMLELCLLRMPNQNLTDEEARNLLEYMRKNDGVKP